MHDVTNFCRLRSAQMLIPALLIAGQLLVLADTTCLSADDRLLSRIAFGSCAKQDKPQPIWDAVLEGRPELFVFLGDNIYGDTTDMQELKAKWDLLGAQPGFQKLRQSCPVIATWDDHDFGADDSGADYPKKRESQQLFLNFFRAPDNDPRRSREGVYSSGVYGPEGRRIQFILLDTRYFRSPLRTGFDKREPGDGYRGKYIGNTDPDATILGETQWKWLAEQLKVPAEIRVIGSSFQVLSDQHGWEMWGNFPLERQKLFRTLKTAEAKGVILLSGDRHLAELAAVPADHADGLGYPIYEVTSSSLNAPSGNMTKSGVRFANEINPYRVGLTFFDVNFGRILVDWDKPDPIIRLQVCDELGAVVLQQRLALSQLQ